MAAPAQAMPTAGSERGTTEIECPSALEITVRLLAHRSHSQKYCRDALQCLDCGGGFNEFASRPLLPVSSTKSLPPRKYRKAVSQDGFAHFVTMNQTSGRHRYQMRSNLAENTSLLIAVDLLGLEVFYSTFLRFRFWGRDALDWTTSSIVKRMFHFPGRPSLRAEGPSASAT